MRKIEPLHLWFDRCVSRQQDLTEVVRNNFDLRPGCIIRDLQVLSHCLPPSHLHPCPTSLTPCLSPPEITPYMYKRTHTQTHTHARTHTHTHIISLSHSLSLCACVCSCVSVCVYIGVYCGACRTAMTNALRLSSSVAGVAKVSKLKPN